MKKFLGLMLPAALFLFLTLPFFAQSTSSVDQSVVDQSVPQSATQNTGASMPSQTGPVFTPEEKIQYFSLEHRTPDQLEPSDAELLKKRQRDILSEAEFYGYDMSFGAWKYVQSVCPLMPDHVMLQYTSKNTAGNDSSFTALVPRKGGRIWTVPVLNNGASRFRPAPADPRNFEIFSQAVPADLARQNSGPEGKWLTLSVCYAEMTGARPRCPISHSLTCT